MVVISIVVATYVSVVTGKDSAGKARLFCDEDREKVKLRHVLGFDKEK